jgi:bacterioferritin-associated ferredoxin
MEADDELCLCFHITWRKVLNYIRIHQVQLPSQLHECGGAGTGCGWCRKQLERLTNQCRESPPSADEIEEWLRARTPNKAQYAEGRATYRKSIGDQPRD